jgi:Tol biopolymer transport system component
MNKINIYSVVIFLSFVFVSEIVALPSNDSDSESEKLAEQHFATAVDLINKLMYQEAITELEKVINLVPESNMAQDAQYWIGQSYYQAGNFDQALSTLEKLIEEYPESAIIPVTQLMVGRVHQAKDNEKLRTTTSNAWDKGVIIDPKTGVKYSRIRTFAGKNDKVLYTNVLNISPNGKFLLSGNNVVPLDGSDAFELVDRYANGGTWSPDGKMVAYYSGDAIMVIPVSPETGRPTGPAKKLIEGEYRFQSIVSWSPDGQRLVFNRCDEKFKDNVCIISIEDGSLLQITRGPEHAQTPAWSPDGKRIAYGLSGKEHSLWISSVDGATSRKIIDRKRRCLPTWSPDGKWIFLTEGSLFIRLDDKKIFTFTAPEGIGGFFDWSPDGKKMLFYNSSYRWRGFLKVVSSSGGPSLEIGKDLTLWWLGPWSPDSKMIVAEGEKNEGKYMYYLIPILGGKSIPLDMTISTKEGILDAPTLSMSPNGKYAALIVERDDETADIFVLPISANDDQTTPAIKIFDGYLNPGATNVFSAWSPDGSKLALVHKNDIWIAYINGDKPSQLTNTPEDKEKWPGWSPDGQTVTFGIMPGGGLYTIPASGGNVSKILDQIRGLTWSPDSKEIAFLSQEMVISIIPATGGKARSIFDIKDYGIDKAWELYWNADDNNIAFIGNRIQQEEWASIFTISDQGENFTEITTCDHGLKYIFNFSPDGKWISYYGEGSIKMRPEASLWEADFEEILEKLSD